MSSVRGTWREDPFTGDPKGYANKDLEMDVCFHNDSVLGNMGARSFTRAFERKKTKKILYLLGEFY